MWTLFRVSRCSISQLNVYSKCFNQGPQRHLIYRAPRSFNDSLKPLEKFEKKCPPPEGYKTVYAHPSVTLFTVCRVCTFASYGMTLYYLKTFFIDPDSMYKSIKIFFSQPSNLELAALFFICSVSSHFLIARHIRMIYKKSNNYRVLFFEVLPTKKLTNLSRGDLVPHKFGFYHMNKKTVFLYEPFFISEHDYYSLISEKDKE